MSYFRPSTIPTTAEVEWTVAGLLERCHPPMLDPVDEWGDMRDVRDAEFERDRVQREIDRWIEYTRDDGSMTGWWSPQLANTACGKPYDVQLRLYWLAHSKPGQAQA